MKMKQTNEAFDVCCADWRSIVTSAVLGETRSIQYTAGLPNYADSGMEMTYCPFCGKTFPQVVRGKGTLWAMVPGAGAESSR